MLLPLKTNSVSNTWERCQVAGRERNPNMREYMQRECSFVSMYDLSLIFIGEIRPLEELGPFLHLFFPFSC